jgi:hypothetical protein
MYDETLTTTMAHFKLVAQRNQTPVRDVVLGFESELTPSVARGIGTGCAAMREALIDGEAQSARFDLGVPVLLTLDCGEHHHKVHASAQRANVRAGKDGEFPRVTLELVAHWEDEDLLVLAHALNRMCLLRIERLQRELVEIGTIGTTAASKKD